MSSQMCDIGSIEIACDGCLNTFFFPARRYGNCSDLKFSQSIPDGRATKKRLAGNLSHIPKNATNCPQKKHPLKKQLKKGNKRTKSD